MAATAMTCLAVATTSPSSLSAFNIAFTDLNIVDNALITIDRVSDFSIALNGTTGGTLTEADFVF